jgi:transposase
MRTSKITQSITARKSANGYDHYLALEWSLKVMAIGHMSRHDEKPRIFERPADLRELKEYLSSLKGNKIITFEESGSAHWLYMELFDYVDRILICNPFHNRLLWHGPKTDKIDAGKLCELLRADLLKEVYHSDSGLYDLRKLVSAYVDVVRAGMRAMNQKTALALGHRDTGKTAAFIGDILQENIDLYQHSKKQYEKRLAGVVRHNKLVHNQREIPGIGTIGAVKIVACVVDGRRFPDVGKYFSYCGLVKHEKLSGGHSYGRRKPRYSRILKSVYKTAALAVLRMNNPMREYYDHLRAHGTAEHNARHAVARYIARISCGMLKNGTRYEPYRWKEKENKTT